MTVPAQTSGKDSTLLTADPGLAVDRFEVLGWDQVRPDHRAAWERLRASRSEFRTPFFSTAFCDAVQASRRDVLVAVGYAGERIASFLPFHRLGRIAVPVGRYFNDGHNVLADPGTPLDWKQLLQACGVTSYDFHALAGSQPESPLIDCHGSLGSYSAEFRGDSPGYLARLERDHVTIRRQEQKSRKMAREIGPLRLELDCRSPELLDRTVEAKRQQYRRTNILDLFSPEWTRSLLAHLHGTAVAECSSTAARGLLSVLYAGDQVVASHFGILENGLLHYWFPTYDVRYAPYSPGTALFKEIVRESSDHGIDCIDMGYGEQPYKRKQTDVITSVDYGCVSSSALHRRMQRVRRAVSEIVRKVPMKDRWKRVLRRVNPQAGISRLN